MTVHRSDYDSLIRECLEEMDKPLPEPCLKTNFAYCSGVALNA